MIEPPERSRTGVGIVVGIVAGAIVAGALVFVWQHGKVTTLQGEVSSARAAQQSAQQKAASLATENSTLKKKLAHSQKKASKTQKQLKQQKQQNKQAKQASALPDGNYFGAFKSVSSSPSQVVVDIEQYLTGKAAVHAAVKDGFIKKGQSLDNDYYIRNQSKQLRTIQVSSSAVVMILGRGGGSPKLHTVSYSDFVKFYAQGGKKYMHLRDHGYHLTITGGKIVKIEEQFVP